jgi:hypothetical protein
MIGSRPWATGADGGRQQGHDVRGRRVCERRLDRPRAASRTIRSAGARCPLASKAPAAACEADRSTVLHLGALTAPPDGEDAGRRRFIFENSRRMTDTASCRALPRPSSLPASAGRAAAARVAATGRRGRTRAVPTQFTAARSRHARTGSPRAPPRHARPARPFETRTAAAPRPGGPPPPPPSVGNVHSVAKDTLVFPPSGVPPPLRCGPAAHSTDPIPAAQVAPRPFVGSRSAARFP